MAPAGLAIRRIATHQHCAPLVVLVDNARQTALPLLEAMVRESLARGLRAVVVCVERPLSADITGHPAAALVDCRRPLPPAHAAGAPARLAELERDVCRAIEAAAASAAGVVVVFDDLQPLLEESRTATLALLRRIRRAALPTPQSRVLARTADTAASASLDASALRSMVDAVVDVYPLDALRTWMPGWYSDGRPAPLIAAGDNDCRRCLAHLEHRKQLGKVGHELALFEADGQLRPSFSAVALASSTADSNSGGGGGGSGGPSLPPAEGPPDNLP
ncbi:hypothetical protein H4R19_006113, partial [Coemansia spiralis]